MTLKLKILSVTIVVLLAAIILSLLPGTTTTAADTETSAFTLTDSATTDQFVFGNVALRKADNETWTVNGKFPADPVLIERMFSIMQRIEVKRSVADNVRAELVNEIKQNGIDVKIMTNGNVDKTYRVIGKENDTFAQDQSGEVYAVYVPGYDVALYEMFGLGENGWRNRTILSTSARTLRKLELKYPAKPEFDFTVASKLPFFEVSGIKNLDSAMVFNYVQAFQQVRALRYLDDAALKDSLKKVQPYCLISVQDIDSSRDNTLAVYGNDTSIYGLLGKTGEVVLFEPQYFTRYLVRKKDFEK